MHAYQFKYIEKENQIPVGYAWFGAMHTRLDILICNISRENQTHALDEIFSLVTELDQKLNRFNPKSEISNLNCNAALGYVIVSKDVYELIDYAVQAYHQTKGLFDITVNSQNNCRAGAGALELLPNHQSIRFIQPDIQIDLGGIAKGFTVDKITTLLQHRQINDFLISFGNSSISARGNQPGNKGWSVSLQDFSKKFELKNECLSVSGNNTKKEGHIINPKNGLFVAGAGCFPAISGTATEAEVISTVGFINSWQ